MAVKAMLAMDRTLLRAGERVCVAVSGGADSVALLLGLVEANAAGVEGSRSQNKNEPLGVVLRAAHVHHGLRGVEADGDEAFVREVCERVGVPLTVFRVDTAARQAAEGEGVEEAARELRYEALRGLMASGVVDVVATAHTLDDQAETVVMKMLRGAWTEGLGGISPVLEMGVAAGEGSVRKGAKVMAGQASSGSFDYATRDEATGGSAQDDSFRGAGRIVRPLLGVRRVEVEAFLREREQGWREDATNRDVALTRNRVRHVLMPMLREFNPGVDALLARTAEVAREEEAFWQTEVARVLPQVLLPGKPVRGGGRAVSTAVFTPTGKDRPLGTPMGEVRYALEIARLKEMPAALRRRVVRAAARKVFAEAGAAGLGAAASYVMSGEETAKVLALAGFGGVGGAVTGRIGSRLELHGGLRVERSAREIRLWRQG
jgi:tRNA(Ile)-lysidine synthase